MVAAPTGFLRPVGAVGHSGEERTMARKPKVEFQNASARDERRRRRARRDRERVEEKGDPTSGDDVVSDFRLLVSHSGCLTPSERRLALRLARELGRAFAEREDLERATLAVYQSQVVVPADLAGVLPAAMRDWWYSDEALLDARVEAVKAGFRAARSTTD